MQNMGLRYVVIRVFYVIKTNLGILKKTFPINPTFKKFITINDWRKNIPPFFFYGKKIQDLPKYKSKQLEKEVNDLKNGQFTFFSKHKFNLNGINWYTNPETGFQYDISKHWSKIEDISKKAGDIKFVWEKARFSFLYDVIRYDYHYKKDQSEFVFNQIEDFIDKNPINQGPNYKCSQEISLRVLNWTFALYYYKDAKVLSNALFQKIMNAIYWQLHHVYHNIHFSRIAVRNNHAITETLMLYLSNKLFPFIPETKKWSKKGKLWFEKEIAYQIYKDGTFLQFSMNYHRVVIQLVTWACRLAVLNNDAFSEVVYNRAKQSLKFLDTCSDKMSGELPNYGANDGALFFKLTNDDYRVYTSQIDDLRAVLYNKRVKTAESSYWYGLSNTEIFKNLDIPVLRSFSNSGYYIINEDKVKTFIKCGAYKHRPSQADNLHLDIWVNGINYFRDTGSYKYNTSKDLLNYFNGSEGHNTISVDNENQMVKGGRFIWYNWVKEAKGEFHNNDKFFEFVGYYKGFKNVSKNLKHVRKVKKYKAELLWEIQDEVLNKKVKLLKQYWHINPVVINNVQIEAFDEANNKIEPIIEQKWFSGYYGVKEKSIRYTFPTYGKRINTKIRIIKE